MKQKIYSLFAIFIGLLVFGQNSFILVNGTHPVSQSYCPGASFNINLDNAAVSTDAYDIVRDTQLMTAGSTDFRFDSTDPNIFSHAESLGFTFNFFGKNYDQVVVGRNGRAVFSQSSELAKLHDRSVYIDRTFSGWPTTVPTSTLPSKDYNKVYLNNKSQELDLAQIFFGYTDILFNNSYQGRTLYKFTKNYSSGGKTGFLISVQQMIRTDGSGGFSSSAYDSFVWILTTGEVIVRVNNKTTSFATGNIDNYKAILGIQDETGTKAVVPDYVNQLPPNVMNYNNGNWRSEGVSFTFKPKLKTVVKTEWFLDGVLQTYAAPFSFSPVGNQILKAKITYSDGTSEESAVNFNAQTPPSKPNFISTLQVDCAQTYKLEIASRDPSLSYQWFKDGTFLSNDSGNPLIATTSGTYTLKVSNGCQTVESDPQNITITSTVPGIGFSDGQTFEKCGTNSSENFNLLNIIGYSENPTLYTVKFTDAGGSVVDASNGYNYSISSGTTAQITMTVSTAAGVCQTRIFKLKYLAVPAAADISTKLCFGQNTYSVERFKADFPSYAIYDIAFSTDTVNFSTNPVNPAVANPVFVKLSKTGFSCQSVSKLKFEFYPEVIANQPTTQLPPQCGNSTETFNLASLIPEINPGNVTITFHESLPHAQSGTNALPLAYRSGMGTSTLYIRVVDNATGCVAQNIPEIKLVVYKKPNIISANPIVKTNCAGNTIFNLTQNITDLTDAQSEVAPTLEYLSENGTVLTGTQISAYDAAVYGTKPKVVVKYNPTCSDAVDFDLRYNAKPVSLVPSIPVCGEASYSLTDFLKKVATTPSGYTFTDASSNSLPTSFDLSALPKTVTFYMTDNVTGCRSDIQTVNFITGNPTPIMASSVDFTDCDNEGDLFDGQRTFDLNGKKADFTTDALAEVKFYKDRAHTQILPASYKNEMPFSQKIYVQITSTGYCPSYAELVLNVNTPTKSSTLKDKYLICYGDQVFVDAGSENTSWLWNDGTNTRTKTYTTAGSYSVKLTNADGCSYTHNFVISDENQPKISKINQTNDRIEVIAEGGVKPYEYSFDKGSTWQVSNILMNPTLPEYHIQVRSTLAPGAYCLGEIKSIYTITVNNVITPNGDGKNDLWTVENLDKMENADIVISDRYGKTVFRSKDKNTLIWDGKSNGRVLPTASYWYAVKWHDPATNKDEVRSGWILLKNRD